MSNGGGSGSGSGQTGEFAGTLEAHNAVRAAVETTNPLMPLSWSEDLAAVAQDWADTLADECAGIRHRMPNQYGENIAAQWSSNGTAGAYGPQAVDAWAAEIECWGFGTIAGTETCNSQCIAMQNSNGCGHYTQLVWRNTKRVGCGYATCRDGNLLMEIFVCNYDPPGNYRGQAPY
jgi:pathogenesis-related protein 1